MGKVNLTMLSLPRNESMNPRRFDCISNTVLPINSLPGWDRVPLNQKLPMLKCPDNHVIFSKEKIGRSVKIVQLDFDLRSASKIPEYNSLHDPHLRDFFRNEQNLKRLRQNGEITNENDVICTLKVFNEHRQEMLKSQLPNVLHEMHMQDKKRNEDLQIAHADKHAKGHTSKLKQRSRSEIRRRKQMIEDQRRERYKCLLEQSEEKLRATAAKRMMQQAWWERKRQQSILKQRSYLEQISDIKRKRLISMKKLIKYETDRFEHNVRKLEALRQKYQSKKKQDAWAKSLKERVEHEQLVRETLRTFSYRKKHNLMRIRKRFQRKWEQLEEASYWNKKPQHHPNTSRHNKKVSHTSNSHTDNDREIFEKLVGEELCAILTTTVDIQAGLVDNRTSLELNDHIFLAAEYVIQNVITKFTKDMSSNRQLFCVVQARIDNFLTEAKKFLISRVTQLIASACDHLKNSGICKVISGDDSGEECRECEGFEKFVGFDNIPCNIDRCSRTHPIISNVDLRSVVHGKRTEGSLGSLIISSQEKPDKKPNLFRDEMLFIEHYVIKFKREVTVGVGRRVFAAIRCHFENKVEDVCKKLLDKLP